MEAIIKFGRAQTSLGGFSAAAITVWREVFFPRHFRMRRRSASAFFNIALRFYLRSIV